MGKVWGPDAVAKNTSTALYGNISAIAESPKQEGLLYVGTDDGLVQVSEDGGATLAQGRPVAGRAGGRVHRAHPRVAARRRRRSTSPSRIIRTATSRRTCLKSTDSGQHVEIDRRRSPGARIDLRDRRRSCRSAAAVRRHRVRRLLQQGRRAALDRRSRGLPTIAVREIAIQKRENDLVLGTFGRGIYIVDDYSPAARNADS